MTTPDATVKPKLICAYCKGQRSYLSGALCRPCYLLRARMMQAFRELIAAGEVVAVRSTPDADDPWYDKFAYEATPKLRVKRL